MAGDVAGRSLRVSGLSIGILLTVFAAALPILVALSQMLDGPVSSEKNSLVLVCALILAFIGLLVVALVFFLDGGRLRAFSAVAFCLSLGAISGLGVAYLVTLGVL